MTLLLYHSRTAAAAGGGALTLLVDGRQHRTEVVSTALPAISNIQRGFEYFQSTVHAYVQ